MQIFTPPSELNKPEFQGTWEEYNEQTEKYIDRVISFCKEESNDPIAGELVYFPIADGKAIYCVYDKNTLLWLPVGDEYRKDFDDRLTYSDIKEQVESRKILEKLFPKKL